ncbi:3037_t:CDS:1, partial [Cetraspora pellucida]
FAIFQQAYNAAGLQAPVIGEMLKARLLSIWLKLLSENHFWTRLERKKISDVLKLKRNILVHSALNMEVIRTKAWSKE